MILEGSPIGIELAKAFITVRANQSKLKPDLDQTKSQFNRTFDSILSKISEFRGMLAAATGMVTAFRQAWQFAKMAGEFEQTTIAFQTMLGSATETQRTMQDLTRFAAETPFEMPGIQAAARGLIQFGERGAEMMETLKILGDAAAGTSTDFGFLALVYNQIRGVGKLLTQDFRQLATRGVISMQDLANHFKVTTSEAQRMMSAGEISFEDVRAMLKGLTSEGGRFANMMQKQSQSFLGLLSTLADEWNIMKREIGEPIMEILKPVVNLGIEAVGIFRGLAKVVIKAVKPTVAGFKVILETTQQTLSYVAKLVDFMVELADRAEELASKYGQKKAGGFLRMLHPELQMKGAFGSDFEKLADNTIRNTFKGLAGETVGGWLGDMLLGGVDESFDQMDQKIKDRLAQMAEEEAKLSNKNPVAEKYQEAITALTGFQTKVDELKNQGLQGSDFKSQFDELVNGYEKTTVKHSGFLTQLRKEKVVTEDLAKLYAAQNVKTYHIMGRDIQSEKEVDEEMGKVIAKIQKHFGVDADLAKRMLQTGKISTEVFEQIVGTKTTKKLVGFNEELERFKAALNPPKEAELLMNTLRQFREGLDGLKGMGGFLTKDIENAYNRVTGFSSVVDGLQNRIQKLKGMTEEESIIDQLMGAGDKSKEGLELTRKQIKAVENYFSTIKKLEDQQKGEALTKQFMSPLEKFHQEMKEIDRLSRQGYITADIYDQALDRSATVLAKAQMAMEEMKPTLEQLAYKSVEGRVGITEMANRIQDALLKRDEIDPQLEKLKEQIKNQHMSLKKQDQTIKAIKEIKSGGLT